MLFRTNEKGYQSRIRNILFKFIAPSMTTTERDALLNPETGRIIFNSTTAKLNFYDGTGWKAVTSA